MCNSDSLVVLKRTIAHKLKKIKYKDVAFPRELGGAHVIEFDLRRGEFTFRHENLQRFHTKTCLEICQRRRLSRRRPASRNRRRPFNLEMLTRSWVKGLANSIKQQYKSSKANSLLTYGQKSGRSSVRFPVASTLACTELHVAC